MARAPLNLQLNHNADEFWGIYRQSTCAVERRRAQFFAFLAEGRSKEEAMSLTKYSFSGAIKVIHSYHHFGLEGLRDKREGNKGAPRLLDSGTLEHLIALIQHDYQQGQAWSAKKVQSWVRQQTGKEIYISRAYEFLAAARFSRAQAKAKVS